MSEHPPLVHPWRMAILAIAIVFSASAIGGYATYPAIAGWYAGLMKPAFTPPNGLFGPVWTLLYILMAIAFWRVLTRREATGRAQAILWFLIQMALNASWSVAFFGLRSPVAGLVVIALLLIAIVMTILRFRPVNRLAAGLLLPYLLWVSFAAALNIAIFWLNRPAGGA